MSSVCRIEFEEGVCMDEVEDTLHLARWAVEGLVGAARVRLDAAYDIDEAARVIVIPTDTNIGEALVRVYVSFLLREIGELSLRVVRVDGGKAGESARAACRCAAAGAEVCAAAGVTAGATAGAAR